MSIQNGVTHVTAAPGDRWHVDCSTTEFAMPTINKIMNMVVTFAWIAGIVIIVLSLVGLMFGGTETTKPKLAKIGIVIGALVLIGGGIFSFLGSIGIAPKCF